MIKSKFKHNIQNCNTNPEEIDISILGGGPAGLEAALVLSRTRKKIIVFDDPIPPRNAASHGVHNFLGLDGLPPAEIRKTAWTQINKYNSTEFRKKKIVNVGIGQDGFFIITDENKTSIKAKKVILSIGYHDVHPDIPGFIECWGDTIIPCPFCDGYENRDGRWGVVVNSKEELERLPKMIQNWTSKITVIVTSKIEINSWYQDELLESGISTYRGSITKINHVGSKVKSIQLESCEEIKVDTLFWAPPKIQSPLLQKLVENTGLKLDDQGNVKTNELRQTNVRGLYAAGDVRGPIPLGALSAAFDGGIAATSIIREWYNEVKIGHEMRLIH